MGGLDRIVARIGSRRLYCFSCLVSINSKCRQFSVETTNTLVCVACNTPNSANQKFCLNCGEGLWHPCPECEESNPLNSAFCGSCGYDLRNLLKESEGFYETSLLQAKEKAAALDLTAAIRILLAAIESPSLHLKSQKDKLKELVKDYRDQKKEQKADTEDRYEKAKHLFENSSRSSALKILKDIPRQIRTAEVEELISKVQHEVEECKRLSKTIEELVSKKDLLGALPHIKALAVYKPEDEKLKKLAGDILRRVIQSVEKFKRQGKYSEAFSLISKVGDLGSSDTIIRLSTEIKEIVWLANYVKKAQTVDIGLVKGIETLASATDNDQNKKLFAEVSKRFKEAKSVPGKLLGWSPVPKSPSLGLPVTIGSKFHFIEGFEGISVEGSSNLQFHVAAGLAIQGLGLATIALDLGVQKKSFFGFGGKKTAKTAWGIDFGASSVKAVKLNCENQQDIQLEVVDVIRYRNQDPMASNSEQRSNMLEALLKLKAKHDIKKDAVIISTLNPNQVLGRYLSLPDADSKSFKSALEFEVKHQIPFPVDEVAWDHYVFPNSNGQKKLAFVAAARKKDSEVIGEMFTANGMKLTSLQSESVAMYNYHLLAASRAGSTASNAILDLGSVSSTLTIVSPYRIWSRTFGVGTNTFTKSLSRNLRLTSEQADEMLWDLSKADENIAKALMSLEEPYRDLVTEIGRSLKGYENDMEEKIPGLLTCVGGGASLHGLMTFLRHDLKDLSV